MQKYILSLCPFPIDYNPKKFSVHKIPYKIGTIFFTVPTIYFSLCLIGKIACFTFQNSTSLIPTPDMLQHIGISFDNISDFGVMKNCSCDTQQYKTKPKLHRYQKLCDVCSN